MACKFIANVDCSGGLTCKKCGWNPDVAKQRKQKNRASRLDEIEIGKRLRSYRAECSSGFFKKVADQIGGHIPAYTLERMSVGQVFGMPKRYLEQIDAALKQLETEKEVENGDCC